MILPSGPDPFPISVRLICFYAAKVLAAGLANTLPDSEPDDGAGGAGGACLRAGYYYLF